MAAYLIEMVVFVLQLIIKAFGIDSIFYIALAIFIKKPLIQKTVHESTQFISLIGKSYILSVIALFIIIFIGRQADSPNELLKMSRHGGFWIEALILYSATQFVKIEKIRINLLLRFMFSLIILIPLELWIIKLTAIHRDYLPSTNDFWAFVEPNIFILLGGILLNVILFLFLVALYYIVKNRVRRMKRKPLSGNF